MKKLAVVIGLGLVAATAPAAPAQGQPVSAVQDLFLRSDLALAKTPSLYFVILTKSGRISVRAGGLVLREWKIARLRSWGTAPPLETLTLEKKTALNPPQRKSIVPAPDEETPEPKPAAKKDQKKKAEEEQAKLEQDSQNFELEALELKDMPARFTIILSDGTRIQIHDRPHKLLPRLASLRHTLSWYVFTPMKFFWSHLKKRSFGTIDITFDAKEDAQAVYWALADGAKGLVFPL